MAKTSNPLQFVRRSVCRISFFFCTTLIQCAVVACVRGRWVRSIGVLVWFGRHFISRFFVSVCVHPWLCFLSLKSFVMCISAFLLSVDSPCLFPNFLLLYFFLLNSVLRMYSYIDRVEKVRVFFICKLHKFVRSGSDPFYAWRGGTTNLRWCCM